MKLAFIYLYIEPYLCANKMGEINSKQTSPKVATKASAILRNPKSSAAAKSVAASDLAQTRKK